MFSFFFSLFSKVHAALGLDLCCSTANGGCYSAAAPLSVETFKYFQSLDMPIEVLLGSTESSGPQTTNLKGN